MQHDITDEPSVCIDLFQGLADVALDRSRLGSFHPRRASVKCMPLLMSDSR